MSAGDNSGQFAAGDIEDIAYLLLNVVDAVGVGIESEHLETLFCEIDRQGQPHVAQPDDGDPRLFPRDLFLQRLRHLSTSFTFQHPAADTVIFKAGRLEILVMVKVTAVEKNGVLHNALDLLEIDLLEFIPFR